MFDTLRQKTGQPLRFVMAGGINTVMGLLFYPTLLWVIPWFRIHYLTALGIAQIACLVFAFTIYKLGVFRTKSNIFREFRTFSTFYAVNYATNWALLPLLVERGNISPAVAQILFVGVLMVGSYFWHSRVTFKQDRDQF